MNIKKPIIHFHSYTPSESKSEYHRGPPGLKVTNTQQWHGDWIPWYNLYQERKREITRAETNQNATTARLAYLIAG